MLRAVARTERQYHLAALAKLRDQRIGDFLGSRGDDDAVERRPLRRPGKSITGDDGDIGISERLEPFTRGIGERPVALDAHHFAHQAGENCGLIARACADLENAVLRFDVELFGHISDDIRLADRLPASDRQRPVGIGAVGEFSRDEVLARHLVHGAQHRLVADAALAQPKLKLHAFYVGSFDFGHNTVALIDMRFDVLSFRRCGLYWDTRRRNQSRSFNVNTLARFGPHLPRQNVCLQQSGLRKYSDTVGTRTGLPMTSEENSGAGKRILVVEDELMIRMLLQDMLADLGHTLAGEAGRIDEALTLAKQCEFDLAILDVNLNGQPISPVVEVLLARGLPFVFATGYGQRGVPERYRQSPTLQKPFQSDALARAIEAAAPSRN